MSATIGANDQSGAREAIPGRLIPAPDRLRVVPWDVATAPSHGVFGFNSRDIRSRPFNLLRSRVLKAMKVNDWKTIGVVSATPGVGKSFVSCNLAAALSRVSDATTLLLDLDLRRASVAATFDVGAETGIESYLAGDVPDLSDVAVRLADQQLAIVPSVKSAHSSAELLGGRRLPALLAEIRKNPGYSACICDLPPAFANDDAALVGSHLDAFLLVVEDGHSRKDHLVETMQMMRPTPCAGVVLNRYYGGLIADDYGTPSRYSAYYDE